MDKVSADRHWCDHRGDLGGTEGNFKDRETLVILLDVSSPSQFTQASILGKGEGN